MSLLHTEALSKEGSKAHFCLVGYLNRGKKTFNAIISLNVFVLMWTWFERQKIVKEKRLKQIGTSLLQVTQTWTLPAV